MLSPTASNAPARKDTHPAVWNVPVGGESLTDTGAPCGPGQTWALSAYGYT